MERGAIHTFPAPLRRAMWHVSARETRETFGRQAGAPSAGRRRITNTQDTEQSDLALRAQR